MSTERGHKHPELSLSNAGGGGKGDSGNHDLIIANITKELTAKTGCQPCKLYTRGTRIESPTNNFFAEPDLVIVCGTPIFQSKSWNVLLNPTLIVEVLSAETDLYDRSEKFTGYRAIESFAEYLLIAQDRYEVEQFIKQPDESWLYFHISSAESEITLATIESALTLESVYTGVQF